MSWRSDLKTLLEWEARHHRTWDDVELLDFLGRRHPDIPQHILRTGITDLTDPPRWMITDHAYRRFVERSDSPKKASIYRLRQRMKAAKRAVLRPEFVASTIIRHGFEEAEYYLDKNHSWVFVIVDGVLKTCHRGGANRWEVIEPCPPSTLRQERGRAYRPSPGRPAHATPLLPEGRT